MGFTIGKKEMAERIEERLEECERAAELGKPMYAVVLPGAAEGFEGGLARFPWRIVFRVSGEGDLDEAAERIVEDLGEQRWTWTRYS